MKSPDYGSPFLPSVMSTRKRRLWSVRFLLCSLAITIAILSGCQTQVPTSRYTPLDRNAVTDINLMPVYPHEVAYVTNNGSFLGDVGISEFAVVYTGQLTAIGPFITGSEYYASGPAPKGIAVCSNGPYLYVANSGDSSISGYTIGVAGALSPMVGSPFSAGSAPGHIAITPNNKFLYALNTDDDSVTGFNITSNGGLTPVTGGPFATDVYPHRMAITPDGKYLYVTNVGDPRKGLKVGSNGTVSVNVAAEGLGITGYSIRSNGALSPVVGSPFINDAQSAYGIAIGPSGKHLYVTNSLDKSISGYVVGSQGALTEMRGSPFSTRIEPDELAITPDGKHLYATSGASNRVLEFSVDADGGLAAITGPVFTGSDPTGIAISPGGKYLYVTNFGSNNVSGYAIGPDGSLSKISGSFRTGSLPDGIVITTVP